MEIKYYSLMDELERKIIQIKEEEFDFRLPTGEKVFLTLPQARSLGSKEINQRCDDIQDNIKQKIKRLHKKGDGFKPGWQENIREYVTCPVLYKNKLKQKGLVEVGNDYEVVTGEVDKTICANPEFVKEALRVGVQLSGREIDAIESGEYFKN